MSDINEIEVDHQQAEKEKLLSEGEREEPMEQQSGGSQSIDYHSSDGGADDSQAKPVTSDEGHRSDPPPFMLQGSQAGQEAAAAGGNNADATPNPNPSQQGQASFGFSNILGSLNTPTNIVEPATPMDERFQSVNADDIQDLNMNKTQFSNTNLPFAPQSIHNFESLLGNHNLSTSTLPSEFHQADLGTANNGLPNLETEWNNWKQFNMHDSATLLGPQDSQYQTLLNQAMAPSSYQNMPLTQVTEGMEGFNMGSSCINPTYNYMEGFPVQGTKLVDWVSQAPGPEVQNNLTTSLLHPDTPIPSSSRAIKNSVYDPMFEAMGLPVDPHLRMFMARRETGVEE